MGPSKRNLANNPISQPSSEWNFRNPANFTWRIEKVLSCPTLIWSNWHIIAMASPAKRRIVLKDGDGKVYDVQVTQDAVGFDLRRKARPKLADDDLRFVRLRKADNTDLELDKVVPPGVGSDIASAVMVEVEGLVETQQVPGACFLVSDRVA